MESSIVPDPEISAGVTISSSMQDDATRLTAEISDLQDAVADTGTVLVHSVPADEGSDRDENVSPVQEPSVSDTSASGDTSEEPPADEKPKLPTLWCRVELNSPEEWAKCVIFQNPGGIHGGYRNAVPQNDMSKVEHSKPCEPVAVQSPFPKTPAIQYLNRFVDRQGQLIALDPWPEALDLDYERGKQASWNSRHRKPIIQLITIVRTNIGINSYSTNNYRDTRRILSDPRVAAEFVRREVVIDSVRIVDAFKAIITYYPGLELRGITMTVPEPYCVFYHYYEELKTFQKAHDSSLERPVEAKEPETTPTGPETHNLEMTEHLNIVRDFIEGQNLQEVELERKRHLQNPPVATYRMMWLLFKPGTRVYNFISGRATAGVVISVQTDSGPQRPGLRSLKFWTLDFDGFKLGRRELSHNFRPFDGEKRVSELPVSPCELYDAQDNNRLRNKLIDRGKMFWRILPGAQVEYEGKLPDEAIEWVSSFFVAIFIYQKALFCRIEKMCG